MNLVVGLASMAVLASATAYYQLSDLSLQRARFKTTDHRRGQLRAYLERVDDLIGSAENCRCNVANNAVQTFTYDSLDPGALEAERIPIQQLRTYEGDCSSSSERFLDRSLPLGHPSHTEIENLEISDLAFLSPGVFAGKMNFRFRHSDAHTLGSPIARHSIPLRIETVSSGTQQTITNCEVDVSQLSSKVNYWFSFEIDIKAGLTFSSSLYHECSLKLTGSGSPSYYICDLGGKFENPVFSRNVVFPDHQGVVLFSSISQIDARDSAAGEWNVSAVAYSDNMNVSMNFSGAPHTTLKPIRVKVLGFKPYL